MAADAASRTTETDKTENSTKIAQPWGPAIPGLTDAMSASGNIYNNSSLAFGGWPGPANAPMDYRTAGSLDTMWDLASAGNPLANQAYTNAGNIISREGYSNELRDTMGKLEGTMGSYQDINNRASTQGSAVSPYMGRVEAGTGMDSYYQDMLGKIGQPTASSQMLSGPSYSAQNLAGPSYSEQMLAGPSAAKQYLTNMASGAEAENPWLQEMLAAERAKAQNSVSSSFSGSGRMGSGQHYGVMGQKMTEATAPVLAAAYEAAKQRQLAATGQIDNQDLARSGQMDNQDLARAGLIDSTTLARAGQLDSATAQRLGLGLSGLSAMGGFRQGDISNLLSGAGMIDAQTARNYANQLAAVGGQQSAANSMAGISSGAIDRTGQFANTAGSLYGNLYQPSQYGMQVGNAYQQDEQARLNDAIRYWTAAQGFPQGSTSQYSQLMAQLAGLGGVTNTSGVSNETKVGPDTSPSGWQTAIGGATALAGLGSKLGLFSDRRLKREIVKLGTAPNGLSVYQYRYLWSDDVHIGHIAQEVQKVRPDAVGVVAGFMTVRYDLL
jgi:hypothetical protein